MKVKASLHLHSNSDLVEGQVINYSVFDLLDAAKLADIRVLAHTCHKYFVWDEAWSSYAKQLGIVLIPGVELELLEGGSQNHTLAINCDSSINQVQSFADLQIYKQTHPDLLIIAAHPNFGFGASLGLERLQKYWDIFDAVENSWFYSRFINPNLAVARLTTSRHKPFIATADLHNFNFFCLATDYAVLDLAELNTEAVVTAVKQGNFTNITKPKALWRLALSAIYAISLDWRLKLTKS